MQEMTDLVSIEEKTFIESALLLAKEARDNGEIPVGAIVVMDSVIIGTGYNKQLEDCDPTAHAEIVALRQAAKKEKNFRLDGAKMFVTVKPCSMCDEAIKRARISEVIFISPRARPSTHRVAYKEANEYSEISSKMLKEFFKEKR